MEVDIRGASLEMPMAISKVSSAAFPIWMELSVLVAGQSAHVSYLSGFALNNEGREQAAMGIAVGDCNRDAKVDFCITISPTTTTRSIATTQTPASQT